MREEEEGDEEEGEGEGERRHLALGRVRTVTDLDTLQERYVRECANFDLTCEL